LRQGPALPPLLRRSGTWRSLAEDRQRERARLPLGQAGRSELPGSHLRHPDRGGRTGRPPADLVPTEPGLRFPAQLAPPSGGASFAWEWRSIAAKTTILYITTITTSRSCRCQTAHSRLATFPESQATSLPRRCAAR